MSILTFFIVMLQFLVFLGSTFGTLDYICDNDEVLVNICVAVRHKYMKTTSIADVENVEEHSTCKKHVRWVHESEKDNAHNSEDYHLDAVLCYLTDSHKRCLMEQDRNQIAVMLFDDDKGHCVVPSPWETIDETKYLKIGVSIREGLVVLPHPQRHQSFSHHICSNIDSMKTFCVGLNHNYKPLTSYNEAKKIVDGSDCSDNVLMISKTGYNMEYRRVALCYTSDSSKKCIIDSRKVNDEVFLLPYELQENKPTCLWNIPEIKKTSKNLSIKNGSTMMIYLKEQNEKKTKQGFFSSLIRFLTGGCFTL